MGQVKPAPVTAVFRYVDALCAFTPLKTAVRCYSRLDPNRAPSGGIALVAKG